MKAKNKKYFSIVKASQERGEIHIYDDIVSDGWRLGDETSAVSFRDDLKALEDVQVIDVRINSGGGDVFEAAAIYNMLKRHKARVEVHIDGLAASAASVIAMAGDKVTMPKNSMLMIHNAWTFAFGNHNEMRKLADDLEKINDSTVKQSYLSKNPEIDADELSRLMDEETWLSADEALEMGLADEVISAVQVAASISKDVATRYKNVPADLVENKNKLSASVQVDISGELKEVIATMQKQIDELTNHNKKTEPANNGWLF